MAGVPSVIATAYDVDDAEAPRTMRLLHAFLRNGDDAAEALRKRLCSSFVQRVGYRSLYDSRQSEAPAR